MASIYRRSYKGVRKRKKNNVSYEKIKKKTNKIKNLKKISVIPLNIIYYPKKKNYYINVN